MNTNLNENYPRTLFEWLKSDDKILVRAIADGQSVLEVAEDLQREHISVMRRLNGLDIFPVDEFSDEWVELMGLGLAGVPMKVVIDWCGASPERLEHEDIEAMAMGDMRAEFALARDLHICVVNSAATTELSWLIAQPDSVRAGYPAACLSIIERFDVVTPVTLKNQVLGFTPALPARKWAPSSPTAGRVYKPRKKIYRRKTAKTYGGFKRKSYARALGGA